METKCGTRYVNAVLQYGPLYQYSYGRGVEEMKIMSYYLSSKRDNSGLQRVALVLLLNFNCPLSNFS